MRVTAASCDLQLCFALRYAALRLLSRWRTFSPPSPLSTVPLMRDVLLFSCCVLIPASLSLTALSHSVAALLVTLAALVAVMCVPTLSVDAVRASDTGTSVSSSPISLMSPTLFVSLYRLGLLLSTAVAILGVDFAVFPRRLAKTEEFGVSPMDAGVGGFMFAAALTSHAARSTSDTHSSRTGSSNSRSLSVSVRRQLPVLLLGCLRLLAVKLANYQEHVTEYGLHWNFFFTLAAGQWSHCCCLSTAVDVALWSVLHAHESACLCCCALCGSCPVSVLCDLVCRVLSLRACGLLGVALLVVHQLSLSRLGLSDFILHAARHSWMEQNREGVASVVGYSALYLIALQLAEPMMRRTGKVS